MKKKRRKSCKSRKIIIILFLCVVISLEIAYSVFETNINVNVKGNIKKVKISKYLKTKVTISGDGLYKDSTEDNRDIYRGTDPDNYIRFGNDLWRIVAIESDDTIEIMRNDSIGQFAFDIRTTTTTGPRLNSANTYCGFYLSGYYHGCNAWGALSTEFVNGTQTGTVTENASLTTYLNNEYLNTINTTSIISETYYFGGVPYPDSSNVLNINEVITKEKKYTWNGFVGLLNLSDYIKSSLDISCTTLYSARIEGGSHCKNQNYLNKNVYYWLIDPWSNFIADVWTVRENGTVGGAGIDYDSSVLQYAATTRNVFPVVYLSKDTVINGSGTQDEPYSIVN